MKRTLTIIGLAASLLVANAQTNAPSTPVLDTIGGWIGGAANVTNWSGLLYGSFAENGSGAGVLAVYHPTRYVGVGLGGDWFKPTDGSKGEFTMTSANLSLRLPVKIGPANVSMFGGGGVGIPLSGAGDNNGDAALIGLSGFTVSFPINERWNLFLGYAATFWENTGANDGWRHNPMIGFRATF